MPCPLTACAEKALTMPMAAKLLLAACVGALGFVYVMQYRFGIQPCILCMWQRAPYAAALLISLAAWISGPSRRFSPFLLGLCAACFLTGFGLAIFHTGVELHWWLGTSSCGVTPLSGATPDDLRAALLHTVTARCDEVSWSVLGLSMANLNIGWSLLLAIFATAAAAHASQD